MKKELDELITVLDDAVDMQDDGKYQDLLDSFYQDGLLHEFRRYLNKQAERVQELENHITKMAVSRYKDSEELDEVNKQNKRYREAIKNIKLTEKHTYDVYDHVVKIYEIIEELEGEE